MIEWGGTTKFGWVAVSRTFLRSYAKMGLSSDEAMLVVHLLDRQWGEQDPFPKVSAIAIEMGLHEKTVRKHLKKLRDMKFLTTTLRAGRSNSYDFSLMFERLRSEAQTLAGRLREDLVEPTMNPSTQPSTNPSSVPTPRTTTRTNNKKELEEGKKNNLAAATRLASAALEVAQRKAAVKKAAVDARKAKRAKTAAKALPVTQQELEDKPLGRYNCNDLEKVFRNAWSERWPNVTPKRWTGRERKNAKDLISEYTAAEAVKTVEMTIEKWNVLMRQFDFKGYPNMPLIYGYRGSLVPMAKEGEQKPSNPKWGSHYDKDETRDDGKEGGWG